jgi:hypothetical protein
MTKTHCDVCDRNFKNEEALEMHNRSKHASPEKSKSINTKKMRNWTIGIIVLGVIIVLVGWAVSSAVTTSSECKTAPVSELFIESHTTLAMHVHATLSIIIDNVQQQIPANIGISPGRMSAVHTHDATGELHIEPPCVRDIKVGDFFEIRGQTFSSECILDKCTDSGTLTMTVNGEANNEFNNYNIRDHDNIVIRFDSN